MRKLRLRGGDHAPRLAQMAANRLDQYRARAEECQHTADLFPEDHGPIAELARKWRFIAEQSPSGLAA